MKTLTATLLTVLAMGLGVATPAHAYHKEPNQLRFLLGAKSGETCLYVTATATSGVVHYSEGTETGAETFQRHMGGSFYMFDDYLPPDEPYKLWHQMIADATGQDEWEATACS